MSNDHHTPSSPRPPLSRGVRTVAAHVERIAFWTAVGLPLLYVPALVFDVGSGSTSTLSLAVVLLHAVAVLLGYGHRPRTESRDSR